MVDFERLDQYRASLNAEDVYCALGTTIKKAGSREAFYRVDYNYPFQVAYLAKQQNAQRFLMVSAMGANPTSRVFYSRVKGEAENAILELGLPQGVVLPPFAAGWRARRITARAKKSHLQSANSLRRCW